MEKLSFGRKIRIEKLDGLRGIFCLLIVFLHIEKELIPIRLFSNFFVRESYIFVDYFFVLSGFVISLSYPKIFEFNLFSNYLKKRFVRLYPLLIYTTIIMFLWILFRDYIATIKPHLFEKVKGESLSFNFQKLIDTLLLTNSTKLLGNTNGINYPTWSISAEMISYFLFGLISWIFKEKKKIILLAVYFFSLAFCILYQKYFFGSEFGFVRGIMCFSAGSLAYELYMIKKIKIAPIFENILPFVLLLLMFILYYLYPGFDFKMNTISKQIFGAIFIPTFFSISIYILTQTNSFFSKILESKILLFLGKISYSIYLNHALMIILIPKFFLRIVKVEPTELNQILVLVLTLIIIVAYSLLTYNIIEKRCQKLFSNKE